MPGFASIIDQKRPIRVLSTCLNHGTIPHALLFTGINGVGKRTVARLFSMACNCERRSAGDSHQGRNDIPCGGCRSCKKIASGSHPDVIYVKPSGNVIKISQIRDVLRTLSMKPYEAKMRVVTIGEAEKLNPEAGNALLKVLEEPPDGTLIILTALNTADLLPTIVSRSQEIRFGPISQRHLMNLICLEQSMDAETAQLVTAMASGSISKARTMSDPTWLNHRNWLLGELETLASRPNISIMALAEILSSRKETLSDTLDLILTWLRDLWVVRIDPKKVIQHDVMDRIQLHSNRISRSALMAMIDAVQETQKELRTQSNVRLMLENLMLKLAVV